MDAAVHASKRLDLQSRDLAGGEGGDLLPGVAPQTRTVRLSDAVKVKTSRMTSPTCLLDKLTDYPRNVHAAQHFR
jgi:hypothetical protein